MIPSRQFSLLQLLTAITVVALAIGMALAMVSGSGIVIMLQLLFWLPLVGGAIGSSFGRLREGAILGACLWEVTLVVALILRG